MKEARGRRWETCFTELKVGLKFIGDYEKFANDPEADTLLTRVYRKPYVVPDEV